MPGPGRGDREGTTLYPSPSPHRVADDRRVNTSDGRGPAVRRVDTTQPMIAALSADIRETVRTNWPVFVGLALIVLVGGGLLVGVEVATRGWSFLTGLF